MKRIQKVKDKENAPQTGEPLQEEEGRNGDDDEDIDVKRKNSSRNTARFKGVVYITFAGLIPKT